MSIYRLTKWLDAPRTKNVSNSQLREGPEIFSGSSVLLLLALAIHCGAKTGIGGNGVEQDISEVEGKREHFNHRCRVEQEREKDI